MKPTTEDMHSVMEVEAGVEAHDVFVELGVLILEGRIPGGAGSTGRGYGEGPHCSTAARHDCDPGNNFLCKRAENFRKHMRLLWQNNIPMCIEVLLSPDCACGTQKAQSPEVANIPSPADLLLEQWMVTMVTKRCPEMAQISVRGLFQAVRSQLHFSQLSAWWSSSKGQSPAHVSYRVTVPGEAFASQFQRPAFEHSFPMAGVARNTAIKVCVRTLPRMEAVPRLACSVHSGGEQKKPTGMLELELGAVGESVADGLVVDHSSSKPPSDPLLGASLLDPPPSLDLFGRRYQSPSRSSPSMETPEHLLFGRWRDGSPPSPPLGPSQQRRLGRQGLVRRRDQGSDAPAVGAEGPWPLKGEEEKKEHVISGLVDDRMQNPCTRPGKHHCRCAFDEDAEMLPLPTPAPCRQRRNRPPSADTKEHSPEEYPSGKQQQPSTSQECGPTRPAKVLPPPVLPTTPSCSYPSSSKAKTEAPLSPPNVKMELVRSEEKATAGNKFNLELSRREFEEVLAVLRDRNGPPKSHAPGNSRELQALPSKLRYDARPPPPLCGKANTVPRPVASSTHPACERVVFHASASHATSTSTATAKDLAGSSYKADLLMEAILRTSGNQVFKKSMIETTSDESDEIDLSSALAVEKMVKCKQKPVAVKRTSVSESCDKCNLERGKCSRVNSNIESDKSGGQEAAIKDFGKKSLSSVESGKERTRNDSLKIDDRVVKDRTNRSAVKVHSTTTTSLPCIPFTPEKVTTSIYVQNTSSDLVCIASTKDKEAVPNKRLRAENDDDRHPKCLSSLSLDRMELPANGQNSSGSGESVAHLHVNIPSDIANRARTIGGEEQQQLEVTLEGSRKNDRPEKKIAMQRAVIPILNRRLGILKESPKKDARLQSEKREEGFYERPVPTARDKAQFRRSLDSAASMVFHCRTGLPLTSSPAPVRKGATCFDFDSSLNSVSAIRSALFESVTGATLDDTLSLSSDDTESEGSARSPCSPGAGLTFPALGRTLGVYYTLAPCSSLLGSFEESVLNGRLEPVSTVQGFTADLGASGSFCPRHLVLPVTVFFYTLGDNDKVSTPYLGHINLGKKGYNVPRSGTIQVTLFNPLGTVVKMFVVMYDLADMPSNSQTFLRQRTLYMPASSANARAGDGPPEDAQKWLRYLIHLRFSSSKSGRIYLHTDIRMIIFRKSDFDTATAHGMDMSYELRSFTHGPTNPKFSPRK